MTGVGAVHAVLAVVLAMGTLIGPLVFVLVDDRPRRRPVNPPAPDGYGTGVERVTWPASALPRSPQAPVGAVAPDTAPAGLSRSLVDATRRQTAAPTSPHARRVIVDG